MNITELNQIIIRALKEDAARHDITTTALIPPSHSSTASIIFKQDALVCGVNIVKRIFHKVDSRIRIQSHCRDGQKIKKGTLVALLKGKTRALLAGERTALNFLSHLSGIATQTNQFVQKAGRAKTKIMDTRKTTPGLRLVEKYAVVCGGGFNHRYDLSEMILIKDNHREACQPGLSIVEAIRLVRQKTKKRLEIEVDNLNQFQQALSAKPDIILLDNMSCRQMRKAVIAVKTIPQNRRPLLEASGGIKLNNVRAVAQTGVDRISIGSLTHTHKAIDVSMELIS